MSNLFCVQIQTAMLLNYLIKFQTCSTFHEFSYFSYLLLQRNDKKRFHFENNFCQMAWRTHSHVFPPWSARQMKVNFSFLRIILFKSGRTAPTSIASRRVAKWYQRWKKTLCLLESIKSIICKISTNYCPLSKVFCLPHYYRKDVIPPTGVYKQFFILNKMFCVWKRGGGHPVI